jgi:hypothetical protein
MSVLVSWFLMPPDMVCIVFVTAHLGNGNESIKSEHPYCRFYYSRRQDEHKSGGQQRDLQHNMDFTPQQTWHFSSPESSLFGRGKGFNL